MVDLTRRQWLVNLSPAVVGGLEAILGLTSSLSAQTKKRTISFEQALQNSNLREKYIREILYELFDEENINKYFANIYYDHSKSLFRKNVRVTSSNDLDEIDKAGTLVFQPGRNFGNKVKSDFYVFGGLFETKKQKSRRGIVELPSSEALIKAVLGHEYLHAKGKFEGVTLGPYQLHSSDYYRINPYIRDFVEETRGFINQIEVVRVLEKPDLRHLVGLVDLPKAYLRSLLSFARELNKLERRIKPGELSSEELQYVTYQLNQIKKRTPEMIRFPVVRELYSRFGVK